MSLFSSIGALGKIAGAFKAFMNWLNIQKWIEAGRSKERDKIATEQEAIDAKARKARNRISDGDDARSMRHRRLRNRSDRGDV